MIAHVYISIFITILWYIPSIWTFIWLLFMMLSDYSSWCYLITLHYAVWLLFIMLSDYSSLCCLITLQYAVWLLFIILPDYSILCCLINLHDAVWLFFIIPPHPHPLTRDILLISASTASLALWDRINSSFKRSICRAYVNFSASHLDSDPVKSIKKKLIIFCIAS